MPDAIGDSWDMNTFSWIKGVWPTRYDVNLSIGVSEVNRSQQYITGLALMVVDINHFPSRLGMTKPLLNPDVLYCIVLY